VKKKIFLFLTFIFGFAFIFLVTARPSLAKNAPNTFDCRWQTRNGGSCVVGGKTCDKNHTTDPAKCSSVLDKTACKQVVDVPCIADTVDSKRYWCDDERTKLWTAIGCVPVMGVEGKYNFLNFVIQWAIGIGGGIAFLLIIYSGFMIMTASGSPERLQAGRELLTSAISGLILLIFSIFILKFIGVDILGLNKFGFGT